AEEATAANKQSEQDYVRLLVSSGYMNMVQLLNVLHHLSTEPDRSETVKGEVSGTRAPQPSSSVTVTSNIPLSDPITATASRTPQKCEALAYISTQPIHRQVPISYRIYIRTMARDPNRQDAVNFERYYSTSYVPDDANPGFLKLAVNKNDRWLLGEVELYPVKAGPNGKPSPDPGQDDKGAVSISDTAKI